MGLLQKAVETYEAMDHLVGVYQEGKEPLAPIGHIIANAKIEVTISKEGEFIKANKVDKKIIIPVSEGSAGRAGMVNRPHPLCDQVGYICGEDKEKSKLYIKQLRDWCDETDDEKLQAVCAYVAKETMQSDLLESGIITIDKNKIKEEKDVVCWRIVGTGGDGAVWTDRELQREYAEYFQRNNVTADQQISMVSGVRGTEARIHLKGVVSLAGNAKIVSSNDSTNFTYRGRFLSPEEAMSISYIDSQKAHNALKWIIANQKYQAGNRTFICWNPQGAELPKPTIPVIFNENQPRNPSDYQKELKKVIKGYKACLPDGSDVVIASFEAATSGRLAVTYYNDLQGSDFLDRLQYWDETCCWFDIGWGTSSPSLYNIILYAFGTERGSDEKAKVEVEDRIVGQHMQRLLICRLEKAAIPYDILRALVQRASMPECYNHRNRRALQFTACAVVRKYHKEKFKEEWEMALEPDKKDRSYQFGRLLAVLEKAERDTYDSDEKREPNAVRMQSVFVQRPGYAAKIILDQIKNAYYPRLSVGSRMFYERLIGEIMQVISEFGDENYNKPLKETYVMGYYLQKNALYTKKNNDKNREEETDND